MSTTYGARVIPESDAFNLKAHVDFSQVAAFVGSSLEQLHGASE